MFNKMNVNPVCLRGDDCTVRAIATALGKKWEEIYTDLCVCGLKHFDMPSANHVWGDYLKEKGWSRHIIPDTCPSCYSVKEFCKDNPKGIYILALHGHVVAVVDGVYCDSWDSGDEIPIYYWKKEKEECTETNQ